jgi:hypothetical protein
VFCVRDGTEPFIPRRLVCVPSKCINFLTNLGRDRSLATPTPTNPARNPSVPPHPAAARSDLTPGKHRLSVSRPGAHCWSLTSSHGDVVNSIGDGWGCCVAVEDVMTVEEIAHFSRERAIRMSPALAILILIESSLQQSFWNGSVHLIRDNGTSFVNVIVQLSARHCR